MAEESAVIEAPAAPAEGQGESVTLKSFGDLNKIFDSVYPATVGQEGDDAPVVPAAEPAPATKEAAPVVEKKAVTTPAPADDELPAALFGETEKKPETVAAPEIKVPEWIKKPKDIESWRALHTVKDQEKARADAAEAKLAALTANPPQTDDALKARLTELEQQNKVYSDKMAAVDLQSHPVFQQRFVKGREELVAAAASVVKDAGLESAAVEKAMSLTGKAKIEALDEIVESITSPTLRSQLAGLVVDVNNLDRQREAVLADSKGSLGRLQQHEKAERFRQMQEQEKQLDGVFKGATKFLSEQAGFELFKKIEGNDKWNAQVDSRLEKARNFLTKTTDPSQIALAAHLASTAEDYRNLFLRERKLRLESDKRIKAFEDAEPGLDGNSDRTDEGDDNLTFAQSVARGVPLR